MRISKYKNIFAKWCTPYFYSKFIERGFLLKKARNSVLWTYVVNDLNGEEIVGPFYKRNLG